ncbi:hypothetical protein ACJZ2D_011692 [Fusarium nematophilum]
MLEKHGDPEDGYILVQVNSTRPGASTTAPYLNYIHQDGRAIMCAFNFRNLDHTPRVQQMKWTDVLAASCVEVLGNQNRTADTMVALSSVWRMNITNGQTQGLIGKLASRNRSADAPFEIHENEPLFFALLASDHGRGVASMLADYPWMFGFKTIVLPPFSRSEACQVFTGDWNLWSSSRQHPRFKSRQHLKALPCQERRSGSTERPYPRNRATVFELLWQK